MALPDLRFAAGQQHHLGAVPRRLQRDAGLVPGRRLRERPHRGGPARPRRHLRRLLRRVHHQGEPPDRRVPADPPLPAAPARPGGAGPQLPLPVERPDPALAPRPGHPLPRLAGGPHVAGPGPELAGDQPRPDHQQPRASGLRRGADHPRQHRRRGVQHPLLVRGVAPHARRAVGGQRRRPRPHLP